ncbi:uncharacterized protein LOC128990935 [Macrosteles quadrilineatus]|uniref:uncharacterized protein LOC128990935 n=1 Tax=Macrosteles quadrilineatus TaxID=74068 RepID=UPI0023E15196|nr:uncharacterized protein LOC128990935 [Macrosteles quadrilineatus]
MKAATILVLSLVCFLCLISEAQPAPTPSDEKPLTFWDRIFNIPRSVLKSTKEVVNRNGVKCKEGETPVEGPDGNKICKSDAEGGLDIARSAIDSVNDFLNG